MTLEPHTCSEYNPKDNTTCGKPAPFTVVIWQDFDDPGRTSFKTKSRKCRWHIRRYNKKIPNARVTITAEKDPTNGKQPNRPATKGRLRGSPASRK